MNISPEIIERCHDACALWLARLLSATEKQSDQQETHFDPAVLLVLRCAKHNGTFEQVLVVITSGYGKRKNDRMLPTIIASLLILGQIVGGAASAHDAAVRLR